MALSRQVSDLLNRLAAEEARFLAADFLAPALRQGTVFVRIADIICRFKIDAAFAGWGVFRPTSITTAKLLRPATLTERRRYLAALPQRRLILCHAQRRRWLAWPAQQTDHRFTGGTLIPVRLVEEAQLFDGIVSRSDGVQCWFESLDERVDPSAAVYLREELQKMTPPEQIGRRGLTLEQRTAYAATYALRQEAQRDRTEDRLRDALAHAGGKLSGYLERDDAFRVEFHVEDRRHVAMVAKEDLSLQLAGICLSGEDRRFDLQSLVGVLREADAEGVLPIGADNQGLDEEQYWRVHPPPAMPEG